MKPLKRPLVIAGILLLLAAGGVVAYTRLRPQPATARGDPALTVALAINTLERSGTYRLTDEQVAAVLPLLRVLRDADPNDVEASRALAQEIMRRLTPEQRAGLERIRETARQRRQEQGGQGPRARGGPGAGGFRPGGPGGPGGVGPGGGPGPVGGRSRAEIRRRVLGRLIEVFEVRR